MTSKTPTVAFIATLLIACVAMLCLSGCASDTSNATAKTQTASPTPSPRSTPITVAESADTDEAEDSEDRATNEDENEDDSNDAGEFHGYRCTVDCSGHDAGYRWAEEHDIHDPDDCGGKSQSFIEGCRAWAEENPE